MKPLLNIPSTKPSKNAQQRISTRLISHQPNTLKKLSKEYPVFQLLRTKGWYVFQNQKHVRVRPLRSRLGALHKTTKRWLLSTGTLVPFLLVSGDPVHPLYSWQPFGEKMVTAHGGACFSALCLPTGKRYVNWSLKGNTVTLWQNTCILVEKSD